jgi:hypothetical protein
MNNVMAFIESKLPNLKTYNALASPTQAQTNAVVKDVVQVVEALAFLFHNNPNDAL